MSTKSDAAFLQHQVIAGMVKPGASVLDLGCGNGDLMARLIQEKKVRAQGIEIHEQAIYECVSRGLSVFHGDIDSGLSDYADKSIDYVILNHTFQQVKKPEAVLKEALRVGTRVIVGFPNFAHYSVRWQIGIRGRTPVNPALPYQWYDTPNLHFLSISDFASFCGARRIKIEQARYIGKRGGVTFLPDLFGLSGIFLISAMD